ncbi:MAG: hypothetical protein ABJJ53_09360 [Sulfitobacter sp.]
MAKKPTTSKDAADEVAALSGPQLADPVLAVLRSCGAGHGFAAVDKGNP